MIARVEASRVAAERLQRQLVSRQPFAAPGEVVAWLGAVQAQDYLASLWALGLRTRGAREADVEAALAAGRIIRTHGFRGTWQYVAPDDVRWMLGLVGPRVVSGARAYLERLGLDGKTLARSVERVARALAGGTQLTRDAIAERLGPALTSGDRLRHIVWVAELRGVVCSGARAGKQQTYALLDERVPATATLTREEALARLATRYFQSRGPATARDLAWWSGLPLGDVREAVALAGGALERVELDGTVGWMGAADPARLPSGLQLLPTLDECLVGYRDRSALVDPTHTRKLNVGNGLLRPTLLAGGRVVGTWGRTLGKGTVALSWRSFARLDPRQRRALDGAVAGYATFLARTHGRLRA
jgi:hypothetical protein